MGKRRPIAERFWEKVESAPAEDCWLWSAATSHGYGVFSVERRRKQAHRVAYELMIGPIPPLLVLDHLCKTPRCVNPYHLDPVPLAVNSARTNAGEVNRARQFAKTHCVRGHDLNDPEVAKVTPEGYRKCRPCRNIWYAEWSAAQPKVGRGRKKRLTIDDVLHIDALRGIGVRWANIAEDFPGVNVYTLMNAHCRKKAYADYPREA